MNVKCLARVPGTYQVFKKVAVVLVVIIFMTLDYEAESRSPEQAGFCCFPCSVHITEC